MSNFWARRGAVYVNEMNQSLGALLGIATGHLSDAHLSDAEIAFLHQSAPTRSASCGKLWALVLSWEFTMSRPIEALAEEVLQLPTEVRSRLLDRVVASLDADRARDQAWDAVAARRDAEIDSGSSASVLGPEVLARLRAELN